MSNKKMISDLVSEVLTRMEGENHSRLTIADYRRIYDKFAAFCCDIPTRYFSNESGQMFLETVKLQHPGYDRHRLLLYERAILRLKCIEENVVWKPNQHKKAELCSSCFGMVLEAYSNYLQQNACSEKYSHSQLLAVSKFLQRVENHGIIQLKILTAKHIYDIFVDWEYSIRTRRDICAFLKYAYIYKIISTNLAAIVPAKKRHYAIPSVYTPEEIEKILATVDRNTATGKRNYAIMLLAARLGIRRSDIAALTFDSLKSNEIVFVQTKTKRRQSLPFLPEIKAAIDDYINNSRPKSSFREIFLDKGGYGPISAGNVSDITRRVFVRSGVDCKNRRIGPHALRASLATALLAEGNSYFTVQKVLDHANVQTSKSYAKADIEQLCGCALPVPAPRGNFKALLQAEGTTV